MSISSYPRRGHPIAPEALRVILDKPIPSYCPTYKLPRGTRLSDLDSNAWEKITDAVASRLGDEVIKCVSTSHLSISETFGNTFLPMPPRGLPLSELELEVRTYNCLKKHWPGCQFDTSQLGNQTVGQVMKISGFGIKSLIDLLTSLEATKLTSTDLRTKQNELDWGSSAISSAKGLDQASTVIDSAFQGINFNTDTDPRLGDLLTAVEEKTDEIRNGMHRVVWLLHCGYDVRASDYEAAQMAQSLKQLDTLILKLGALRSQVQEGDKLKPQIDVNISQLALEIHSYPGVDQIYCDDVRLGAELKSLNYKGETLQEIMQAIFDRERDPNLPEKLTSKLEELLGRLESMSRQTVESELQDILDYVSQDTSGWQRKIEVMARRYGSDGGGGATLQETSDNLDVSRERVRQLCRPVEEALKGVSAWTPALERALYWVEQNTPIPLSEINEGLRGEGIISSALSFRALRRLSRLYQREFTFETEQVGKSTWLQTIGASSIDDVGGLIVSQARRQISRWGVATFEDVAATVRERIFEANSVDVSVIEQRHIASEDSDPARGQETVDAELAMRVLSEQEDFSLLDPDTGWFWLTSVNRNGLITQIEKVLAVASRIRIADLRSGVSRHHRRAGFAPPQRVLLKLCQAIPGVAVEGQDVLSLDSHLFDSALSPRERVIVDVLREHGPVLTRIDLERHCTAAGIPRGTFYTYIDNLPVLEKYARGIYGLRGTEIDPGFIESLEPKPLRRINRVLTDYGWTSDGKVWLAYTLSQGMLNNGVCSVPAAMRIQLMGGYSLFTLDGSYISHWVCGENQAWSLSPFFRRRGGEVGDTLTITVDLANRRVVAELGDSSLLDEYLDVEH